MFYLAANTTNDSNCDMSYPYFIPDYPEQIFLVLKDMPFKGYSIIPNKYSVFGKLKFLENNLYCMLPNDFKPQLQCNSIYLDATLVAQGDHFVGRTLLSKLVARNKKMLSVIAEIRWSLMSIFHGEQDAS